MIIQINGEEFELDHIKVVDLKENDIIVIKLNKYVTYEVADNVATKMREIVDRAKVRNVEIMVLLDDTEMIILRPESTKDASNK